MRLYTPTTKTADAVREPVLSALHATFSAHTPGLLSYHSSAVRERVGDGDDVARALGGALSEREDVFLEPGASLGEYLAYTTLRDA